jgi:hypothetical protein
MKVAMENSNMTFAAEQKEKLQQETQEKQVKLGTFCFLRVLLVASCPLTATPCGDPSQPTNCERR